MAVQIRLARHGSKKSPFYRIVVTDKRNPRDGRFIENIGTYNPTAQPVAFALNRERLDYWTKHGARPTQTLQRLLKQQARSSESTAG